MNPDPSVNDRKLEHLQIIRHDKDTDRRKFYFDRIHLKHRALPEIDYDQVETGCVFMGKALSFPLLISCMTGGCGTGLEQINRNLARAAEEAGVAMGTGSQRVMLENPAASAAFKLRSVAPKALLFGNLGAVQLNCGVTAAQCKHLIHETGMDALCLHLNPLQEAVQPEGDTCFSGLSERIAEVVQALDVPVIVKEVGSGISAEDAELLVQAGIRHIDVAGAGGTSWSRIEHARDASGTSAGLCFQDWGLPTPEAICQLAPFKDRITLIASGGIRSGLDMVKAMILGASLCGIARPFLEPAEQSADAVIEHIERLHGEFRTAMFLLGIRRVEDLIGNRRLLLNPVFPEVSSCS